MTVKVLVFGWGSLKAALYWCKQFQDLIELKNLDAAVKFMNANILTSGVGHEKWQQAWAKVLGNLLANETNARFNRFTFIQKCGATPRQLKTFATLLWMLRSHPTYILKISNNDLKNSMITYLTFQGLSINVLEMTNFLWQLRNVSQPGRRSILTVMPKRISKTSMI
jgi:hypothetical protein